MQTTEKEGNISELASYLLNSDNNNKIQLLNDEADNEMVFEILLNLFLECFMYQNKNNLNYNDVYSKCYSLKPYFNRVFFNLNIKEYTVDSDTPSELRSELSDNYCKIVFHDEQYVFVKNLYSNPKDKIKLEDYYATFNLDATHVLKISFSI